MLDRQKAQGVGHAVHQSRSRSGRRRRLGRATRSDEVAQAILPANLTDKRSPPSSRRPMPCERTINQGWASGPFGLAQSCPLCFRTCLARGIGRCERSRAMSQAENDNNQDEERREPTGDESSASASARGFAAMDNEKQRQIASKGGAAVSRNREYMAAIGKRGGERVSQNREHMAAIGKKGGERVSQNREHMASIGRKGGEAVSQDREHMSRIGRKGGES